MASEGSSISSQRSSDAQKTFPCSYLLQGSVSVCMSFSWSRHHAVADAEVRNCDGRMYPSDICLLSDSLSCKCGSGAFERKSPLQRGAVRTRTKAYASVVGHRGQSSFRTHAGI